MYDIMYVCRIEKSIIITLLEMAGNRHHLDVGDYHKPITNIGPNLESPFFNK